MKIYDKLNKENFNEWCSKPKDKYLRTGQDFMVSFKDIDHSWPELFYETNETLIWDMIFHYVNEKGITA